MNKIRGGENQGWEANIIKNEDKVQDHYAERGPVLNEKTVPVGWAHHMLSPTGKIIYFSE